MKAPLFTVLTGLTVATVEGRAQQADTGLFELYAGDWRILLVCTFAVGFVHWLKWQSEPKSRRTHATKLWGDIGVAMCLFWVGAALLHLWGKLNMPYLIIMAVGIGMFKKDFQAWFKKMFFGMLEAQKKEGSS